MTSRHNMDKPAHVRLKSRVIINYQQDTCRKNQHQCRMQNLLESRQRSKVSNKLGEPQGSAEFCHGCFLSETPWLSEKLQEAVQKKGDQTEYKKVAESRRAFLVIPVNAILVQPFLEVTLQQQLTPAWKGDQPGSGIFRENQGSCGKAITIGESLWVVLRIKDLQVWW